MAILINGLSLLSGVPQTEIRKLLLIGIPIITGMLSQSVINLVDAALVGQIDGTSLAAVGVGSYATFVTVSIVMGLSAAVQAMVSRYYGAQNLTNLTSPLIAGLLLTIIIGLPLSLLFIYYAAPYLAFFTNDQSVLDIAIPYFQWRTAALIFVGMGFVYRGFWSGIGEAGVYLRIVIWMHIANVIISYLLMFGIGSFQGFGAIGSGMGTASAMLLAALIFSMRTFVIDHRPHIRNRTLTLQSFRRLTALAIPNSVQQTLFALGISLLFTIIGMIGTNEQAIGHILTQLALLLILPAVGLGIAGASHVGQSLGRQSVKDARQWGWHSVRIAVVFFTLLGLPLWLAPEWILGGFTDDPELIALGIRPLQISGLFIPLEVCAIILTQTLLGAGASRHVLAINMGMQWCLFLPSAYLMVTLLNVGLIELWLLQTGQRIVLTVIYTIIWRSNGWTKVQIQ